LFCLWWAIGFAQYRTLMTPPADAIPVYVTAKQWMWKFAYPDGPSSSEMLVVPVGRPVKLIMTSRDVIHSFYVAEFRIKQDVVPGRAGPGRARRGRRVHPVAARCPAHPGGAAAGRADHVPRHRRGPGAPADPGDPRSRPMMTDPRDASSAGGPPPRPDPTAAV